MKTHRHRREHPDRPLRHRSVRARLGAVIAVGALVLVACGDDDGDADTTSPPAVTAGPDTATAATTADTAGDDTVATTASSDAPGTTAAGDAPQGIPEHPVDEEAAACAADATLNEGTLVAATGEPAFEPYVVDDDPESGQGFEAAVAYAVAATMGFPPDAVTWIRTGFDAAIAPGPKDFDFNLQQYGITADREQVVTFSTPYYTSNQALIGYDDSPAAEATDLASLQALRLGSVEGTVGLDFIDQVIQPTNAPAVYNDTAAAKLALDSRQLDGLIVDVPTGFYMTAVELEGASVFGQFPSVDGLGGESWGLLFEMDNPLAECANLALAALEASGALETITTAWMSDSVGVPEFDLE